MKSALVVPSCREACFCDFLRAWEPVADWDEIILVEDHPRPTFRVPSGVIHVAWDSVAAELGADAWIISRRDSAIRAYGFWLAWRRGADLVVTLDDDCYPIDGEPGIVAGHRSSLEEHPRWIESIPGLRTRGLPYANRGRDRTVMASMGLWAGVPDLDAPGSLALGVPADFAPPRGRRLIPRGQYFPMCGMNLGFLREAAPLFYFPLMGDAQPYARFDDIWAGVIAKKVMDCLGWSFSVGEPVVHHRRASDPFTNLVKEAPGIAANESFWARIDAIPLREGTPTACLAELGRGLRGDLDPYLSTLGRALETWAALFQ